jgi:hypothetical protein
MNVTYYDYRYNKELWMDRNPDGIYNPEIYKDWSSEARYIQNGTICPILENWLTPILEGLRQLSLPGLVAHVTVAFDEPTSTMIVPKTVKIGITTDSGGEDIKCVPITVIDGVSQVLLLYETTWNREKMSRLFGLADKAQKPRLWSEYLMKKVRVSKAKKVASCKKKINRETYFLNAFDLIP